MVVQLGLLSAVAALGIAALDAFVPPGIGLLLLVALGAPTLITVPTGSPVIGRTLGELDLRARTGAAVLAIVRGGQSLMLPAPDERLGEDDVVAMLGSDESTASARALLEAGVATDHAA